MRHSAREQQDQTHPGTKGEASKPMADQWLRCRDVAVLLAVSERQVWRLAQSDGRSPPLLQPMRLRMQGRKRSMTRWKLSDVQRLMQLTGTSTRTAP